MNASPQHLRFQTGTRALASVRRNLVRVALSLDDALAGVVPPLPDLPRDADGYLVTSLAEPQRAALATAGGAMIAVVRRRYTRYHADLTIGHAAYLGRMSGSTRSGLERKARRIADVSGGTLDVRRYTSPGKLIEFHDIARRISMRTYQDRLPGAGLPEDDAFLGRMTTLAASDRVRAWLLHIAGEPAAYLYCPAHGPTLRYDYVGHDPAFRDLSPGAVLLSEALRDLFTEAKFTRFDFTEGEGRHKRRFATDGVPCVDMLLLRPSLANRLTTSALSGFDRAVATAKELAGSPALKGLARKVRRTA